MAYLLLIVPILAALTFIIAEIKGASRKQLVFFKALASVLFVSLCPILQLLYGSPLSLEKFLLLFVGLVLGAAGDILLALKDVYKNKSNLFFILGLASFLLGHIAYILFFASLSSLGITSLIVTVNLAALSIIFLKVAKCDFAKMRLPVGVYCIALSVLVGSALAPLLASVTALTIVIFIAAILFFFSDAFLCLIYFKKSSPKVFVPINLTLYYSAQILLAFLPFLFSL